MTANKVGGQSSGQAVEFGAEVTSEESCESSTDMTLNFQDAPRSEFTGSTMSEGVTVSDLSQNFFNFSLDEIEAQMKTESALFAYPFSSSNIWSYSPGGSSSNDSSCSKEVSPVEYLSASDSNPSSSESSSPLPWVESRNKKMERFGSTSSEHAITSPPGNLSPISSYTSPSAKTTSANFDSLRYSPMFDIPKVISGFGSSSETNLDQNHDNDGFYKNLRSNLMPMSDTSQEDLSADSLIYKEQLRDPDADAIKMFVGQIPKSWNEENFRIYFEKFGEIYQLNILRDKITNDSKGCGFVTYFTRDSAIEAQRNLHDKMILPGMTHCIQMKPADSENRKERKLFVGMLPKKMTEEDVRVCFGKFGAIEECTVLKNTEDNSSKGCAFVTYARKADAQNAIRHMNGQILDNAKGTQIVVKNADSQKDKENKRMQYSNTLSSWASNPTLFGFQDSTQNSTASTLNCLNQINAAANLINSNSNTSASLLNNTQGASTDLSQAAASSMLQAANLSTNPMGSLLANQIALVQQQQQTNQLNSILNATGAFSQSTPVSTPQASSSQTMTSDNTSSNAAATAALQFLATQQLQAASAAAQLNASALGLPFLGASMTNPFLLGTANTASLLAGGGLSARSLRNPPHERQREGPEGSNLFIYHLPPDFTDHDLRETFMPFGNVISAKVFIDKNTNLSKCFGFVSYDNPTVAQVAIKAMDGCQVGNKKLKVEHKKLKQNRDPLSAASSSSTSSLTATSKSLPTSSLNHLFSSPLKSESCDISTSISSTESFYAQHKLISSDPEYSLLSKNSEKAVKSLWN